MIQACALVIAIVLSHRGDAAAAPAPEGPPISLGQEKKAAALCAGEGAGMDAALRDPELAGVIDDLVPDKNLTVEYLACRSIQAGGSACQSLAAGNLVGSCQQRVAALRFMRDLFTSNGVKACKDFFALQRNSGPAVDRVCGALVSGAVSGNVMSACPEVKASGLFDSARSCAANIGFLKGDPNVCKSAENRSGCQLDAAFVRGVRDPAQCSASGTCLAFGMKTPAACEGFRKSLFQQFCAAAPERIARSQYRRNHSTYSKGAPMGSKDETVQENLRRIEKGLPPLSKVDRRPQKASPPATETE